MSRETSLFSPKNHAPSRASTERYSPIGVSGGQGRPIPKLGELAKSHGTRPLAPGPRLLEAQGDLQAAAEAYYTKAEAAMNTGDPVTAFIAARGVQRCKDTLTLDRTGVLSNENQFKGVDGLLHDAATEIDQDSDLSQALVNRIVELKIPVAIEVKTGRNQHELHEIGPFEPFDRSIAARQIGLALVHASQG